ncbi:LacI family DNA-binding transcriptional regulator [Sphaerisporangium sp. TRM90804]|uniref:LacI family DNA-binding transcriptional regulator n=1 Tax=Sphaerisporangium sp. TRM90804 TaxID=3031113 RepID=UPI00244A239D|nr:LacI family DNA-binding transcriptional regulator [Sphaerisporangium sp. TRM90804]MDH2425366.1 LacI family DNA-binding transcriptional regulator [Sphaerisporangium sp. TRM90804]
MAPSDTRPRAGSRGARGSAREGTRDGTVGIKQVAAAAGVSAGTVSNVLNRPERVSPATRARVLAAIGELGFVRNGSASSLRAGQGRTVGLMVHDLLNPFFTSLAAGVEDVMSERGHAVIMCSSGSSPQREERNLRMLAEQKVRGVLVTPLEEGPDRLRLLRERGIATVMLDHAATRPQQCSVSVDDVAGGQMAVRHLLERGARDIAYVSGPLSIRQCADRRAGAARAIASAGFGALREVTMAEMTPRAGQEAGEHLLAELPDAVFCANDLLAMGVLRALLRQEVRVPERVLLIGYDDIEYATASAVPLSSVRQPTYQLGRIAATQLLDECDDPGGHAHQQIMFQPELVVRESTTP